MIPSWFKRFWLLLGTVVSDGLVLLLCLTWFWAYFDPENEVLITINEYNEMWWELYLWPVILLIVLGDTWLQWERLNEG